MKKGIKIALGISGAVLAVVVIFLTVFFLLKKERKTVFTITDGCFSNGSTTEWYYDNDKGYYYSKDGKYSMKFVQNSELFNIYNKTGDGSAHLATVNFNPNLRKVMPLAGEIKNSSGDNCGHLEYL